MTTNTNIKPKPSYPKPDTIECTSCQFIGSLYINQNYDGYYCDVDLVPRITVVVDTIVKSRTFEQINKLSDKNMDKPIFQAMREFKLYAETSKGSKSWYATCQTSKGTILYYIQAANPLAAMQEAITNLQLDEYYKVSSISLEKVG